MVKNLNNCPPLQANYQKAINLLVELASLQTSFITLDEVIKTTNRRVNAIEHVIIPRIERTLAYIISELGKVQLERAVKIYVLINLFQMNLREKSFTGLRKFRIRKRKSARRKRNWQHRGKLLALMREMVETSLRRSMMRIFCSKLKMIWS